MTVEYAVLIAVIVAAFVTMGVYLKRGLSGGIRSGADQIGEQYDPRNTTSNLTLTMSSQTTTESKVLKDQNIGEENPADVMITKTTISDDTTTKTGQETVDALGTDLWE